MAFGFWLLPNWGCSPKEKTIKPLSGAGNVQEAFDQALEDKMAKRFPKAIDGFTYIIFNFPGTILAGDAQFQLADCYFEKRDYEQAQTEFDFYLKNFPNGRYQEEASFKLALATFRSAPGPQKDQTKVLLAKELLENFLRDYPLSQFRSQAEEVLAKIEFRLARREFEAARLYFRAGELKSALVYYEFIKKKYPDINWLEIDRFRLAVCYAETGQKEKARPLFEEIVNNTSSPRLQQTAQRYLAQFP
ncbi:MAG: outer membrane protein assembly factor BamD [candidate division WOR-3 bacterium]